MANQYFIDRDFPAAGEEFSVEGQTRHHIFKVMRAKNGAEFELVFNDGRIGLAEVVNAENGSMRVLKEIHRNTELPIEVTIAVGFPKGDKLDFIVEKATELGAAAVWGAPFDWSVVKWNAEKLAKKRDKLSKIAQGAAEQSKRNFIPSIELFGKLPELTEKFDEFDKVLIAYEESAKKGETTRFVQILAEQPKKLLIIFGPEGGISPREIYKFLEDGAVPVSLGPRILRAETAPLYALSVVSAVTELEK
ncbi:MAG: 16S rRNA (uracil(1498)-N(3))-methyltransferase [Streptococcaceae bacterium]|jgi:16S rRNA (uracil1498-N3)-methyltransferase|nr:16S rRNA (uracil(1498)-N(3))-methyltransferase [Streptococcaceae bacterium]